MLAPSYLDSVAEPLQEIYSELQTAIQTDIARRIAKAGEITSASEWQIIKLRQIGLSQAEIQKSIAKALRTSEAEVAQMFKESGLKSLQSDRALQKEAIKAGLIPPGTAPLGASEAFTQIMNANAIRTAGTLRRMTGTIAIDASGKLNQYMDLAQMMVQSGGFSRERAVEMAVKRFAADGVKAFDYLSGVRTTIEAAVRRAAVTGVNQATAEVSLNNAVDMGTDLVEVTSHADSRPEHAEWQGGVYSISGRHPKYRKLSDATGYGTVTGLCGANCRHSFYPFVEGVSERTPKEKYAPATYEAEQEQRYNERQIREWKRRTATLEAGGVDTSAAKGKVAYWQARQQEHIQKHGLARLYERERVYNKSGVVTVRTSSIATTADKLYNTGTQPGNIKAYLRDQPIRGRIQSDAVAKTIHDGKQGKHILGHNNYTDGRSYLTISQKEAQGLVNRFAGTGDIKRGLNGNWVNKEIVTVDHDIGVSINPETGWKTQTNRFAIHYSKNGTHIVPMERRKEK